MSSMPWRGAGLGVILFLGGCAGAGSDAVMNAGFALGASAISRAQGGCYASCPAGTTCNKSTGYCDPLPCRGECSPFEECVEEKLFSRCVARSAVTGKIVIQPAEQKTTEPPASGQQPAGQKPAEPKPAEPQP